MKSHHLRVLSLSLSACFAAGCGGQAEDPALSADEGGDLGGAGSDAGGTGAASGSGSASSASGGGPGVVPGLPGSGGGGARDSGGGGGMAGGTGGETPVEVSCDFDAPVVGTAALYRRDESAAADGAGTEFFHFPWPELTRSFSELAGFPNPVEAAGCNSATPDGIVGLLVNAIAPTDYRDYVIQLSKKHLTTDARHPHFYVAFDGPVGSSSLPSPAASVQDDSAVFLINVEPTSPELGRRTPLRIRMYEQSHYLPAHTLAAAVESGFPLLAATRYALVVRRELGDASGAPLGSSLALEQWKQPAACPGSSKDYLQAFDYLEEKHQLSRQDIAAMTLFDSGQPTDALDGISQEMNQLAAGSSLPSLEPASVASDLPLSEGYYLVEGTVQTPFQQTGSPPYLPQIDGSFAGVSVTLDSDDLAGDFVGPLGVGAGAASEQVQFALSIPAQALDGVSEVALPVVVFGPGTGGSSLSPMDDGVARTLAGLGMAVFSATPVLHGDRAHSEKIDPNLLFQTQQLDQLLGTHYTSDLVGTVESGNLFFNPLNLVAARGNALQAAVDYLWQAKVLAEMPLHVTVGGEAKTVLFDRQRIYFFGHSQGGSIGPLLAGSDAIRAAVFSGTAGYTPAMILDKTKPDDQIEISLMIDDIICDQETEPLDITHPFMALLGHWFEPSDAELQAAEFVAGVHAKHLMVLVGRDDSYAPAAANHAVTTAARLNQVAPPAGVTPKEVLGQALLEQLFPGNGYGGTQAEVQANLDGVTGGFRQYHDETCADDHFVYICNAQAGADWTAYFSSALQGSPVVP